MPQKRRAYFNVLTLKSKNFLLFSCKNFKPLSTCALSGRKLCDNRAPPRVKLSPHAAILHNHPRLSIQIQHPTFKIQDLPPPPANRRRGDWCFTLAALSQFLRFPGYTRQSSRLSLLLWWFWFGFYSWLKTPPAAPCRQWRRAYFNTLTLKSKIKTSLLVKTSSR